MNHRLRDVPKHTFSHLRRAALEYQRFTKRPALLRYSVAAFTVAVAVLAKVLLEPLIAQETPFLLIFLAILVSAWYGGLGPGLAATAGATLVVAYLFLPPLYSLTAFDIKAVPVVLFVLEGVLLSLIVTALRSAQHRAEANALEAQRRQEDLGRSEERYRVVTETASDAIFMIDLNSRILFVNDATEKIFGYASDELLGKRLTMLMPERLREAHQAALKRYVDTGKRRLSWEALQLPGLHKSGKEIPLEVSFGEAFREGEHFFTGFVRDITERKRNEEALALLAEVSRELASSLDYRETLASVARLATAHLANWCVVDMLENDGSLSRAVVAHRDPRKAELARRLQEYYPPDPEAPEGVYQVLRTGEPRFLPEFPEAMLEEVARDEEHLKLLRELGLRSCITVPLVARGRVLGVITLVSSESGKRYEEADLRLAEDLARRIALAVDNARLYDEAQKEIAERERVEETLRQSEERYRAVVQQAAEGICLIDAESKRVLESNPEFQRMLGYAPEEVVGLPIYDFIAHDRENIDRNFRLTFEKGSHSVGERQYRRKDGSLIDVMASGSAISYGGRRVASLVIRDITERKEAEQRLQDTLDRLLALYEASQILDSTLDSEEVVSRLLEIMHRVSHLTAAVISVQEEDGREHVWRAVGLEEFSQRARHAPEAVDARRAALETEEHQLFHLQGSDFGPEHLVGLCLPLVTRDRALSVLEAYGSGSLAESDTVELLGSLASQAASALENARLYGELADRERRLQELVEKMLVAQEEERRHVAYEVHDGLAQIAVAAHTYLNAFARQHTGEDTRGREKLDRALELIEQTVEEARRVIADLRPTALDDFGLATALRLHVEELRGEECETSYEEALGDERLPVPVETALFRVAQEALTNVRKHSGSARVHVELERLDGSVRLEVRDWGRGFELGKGTTKGGPGERVGLVGMQERIALLGGELKVHSEPGAGTSVVAEVPLYGETLGEDNDDQKR